MNHRLTLLSAVLALATGAVSPELAHAQAVDWAHPPASAEPMSRSWWPDAGAGGSSAGLAMVDKHLKSMASGGYGGMEIAMLSDQLGGIPQSSTLPASQRLGQPGIDQSMAQTSAGQCCKDFSNAEAKTVGFGTENWQKVLTQMYRTADEIPGGFVLDLTLSQHWPVAFDNLDPNDAAQLQATRTAYSPITTADVAAGAKNVPVPAQRLWDLDNVPFIFVDHYAAATVMKVASVAANGTPTFAYASLTDASRGTTMKTGANGPAGHAAGIMDANWVQTHPDSFTGTLTAGSNTIANVSSTNGSQRQAGSNLSGPGIPDGTQIVSVSGSSIVMSNPATVGAAGVTIESRWNINTIDADWGPSPSDPSFAGKVDSDGSRRRMADWQYEYQTTIDQQTLDDLGCHVPAPGATVAAGDCVLFGTWYQGTGQTRSGGVNTTQYNREYVTSIYDYAGTKATFDFWENNILGTWRDGRVVKRLGDTQLLDLMRAHAERFPQSSLFEDSLEFSKPAGTGTYWTSDILGDMTTRLGYNAARYAPLLATGTSFDSSTASDELPAARVTEDWTATMANDVAKNHVDAIQKWAKSTLGYNFRVQDTGGVAVRCCSPEAGVHEASADSGAADNGRMVAASATLTGSNWVTAESLTFTRDYTNPWVDVVKGLNVDWAAGINRPQWHGTPFEVTFNGAFSDWPGWEFQHGSPTGWGAFDARQAYWDDVHDLTDYVSRTQAVLQAGVPKVDLAILRGTDTLGAPSASSNSFQTLMDAGWNYHIIDDRMVQLPRAVVTGGRLDADGPTNGIDDGPAYKAVIVNNATVLQAATVKKLIEYANAGLPIIFFNGTPTRVYGTGTPDDNDAVLADRLATLMANPHVYTVAGSSQNDLLVKLSAIGLAPDASYGAANLDTLQRDTNGRRYYYLYNGRTATTLSTAAAAGDTGVRLASTASEQPGDEIVIGTGATQETVEIASIPSPAPATGPNVTLTKPLKFDHASGAFVSKDINTSVTLHGSGQPNVYDAWTGDRIPSASYSTGNGTVTVPIRLASQEATIIETSADGGGALHSTDPSHSSVTYEGGRRLVHRATEPGTYSVPLSNGKTARVVVDSVPAPVDLSSGWNLKLDSWGPGTGANPSDPFSNDPTVAKVTTVQFGSNALGAWSTLPATADQLAALGVNTMSQVSGVGTYSSTFHLPANWNADDGAYLQIGHGNGDMVVGATVNGHEIAAVNQVTGLVDAGPYLDAGANAIEIRIATDLSNRVGRTNQTFGLTGVSFQPYVDTPLAGAGGGRQQ